MKQKRFLSILLSALLLTSALTTTGCYAATEASTAASGALQITEAVSSNKRSLSDEDYGTPDWFELYNAGTTPIDLSGYGVSDNLRNLHKFVFADGTVLQAGEYLVLYASDEIEDTRSKTLCTGFGLSKSGDSIYVTDRFYGMVAQLELPALYTDVSYARREDGGFGFCAVPTPGEANTGEIFSSIDAVFSAQNEYDVVISEVMTTVDDTGYKWVELHNRGDSAVQLEDFYLSDDDADLLEFRLPAGTLAADGYVCIFFSGEGSNGKDGIHASFRLGKEDVMLALSDLQSRVLDRVEWTAGVPEGLSLVRTDAGLAYCAFPTFGAANSADTFTSLELNEMDASDPIHINEVLVNNTLSAIDADGDRNEWVELKNFSAAPISLKGYYLSDNGDNLYKWALPDVTLEAGGYIVVFLSGKNRTEGELHASFGLSEDETELYLTTKAGMRTERFSIADVMTRDDISIGLDNGRNLRFYATPTPGYENAHGFETADSIGFFNNKGVFISEVSAVPEPKQTQNDWIELCNGSDAAVDLTGWFLSDSMDEPQKVRLDGIMIEAGGYAVVETTSHPTRQTAGVGTFGISPAGETIVLSDAQGNMVDHFQTGALAPNVTSGRVESDMTTARVFFSAATKGKANSASVQTGVAAQPTFSDTQLYHTEPFTVTITCVDPNAQIYYTLDGDEPDASQKLYTGPVAISGNTPLRAIGVSAGKRDSEITTMTYLFEEKHTVPVVCISGDPKRIKEVMSVNDKDEKVERLAYISYYETDGKLGTSFPAGIKPKGAGTVAYAQKSLSINLRAGYGQSSVTYPFWDDYEFDTFSALVVRNGGQDWATARIRDSFTSALVEGMYVDNSATRPVVVYINGVYNGLYDLNEDQNSEFLVTHYGVDGDTVDFIRRNATAIAGTNKDIKRVRAYADDTDLSSDERFAEFSEWIDVQYFTDYLIAQTYICNSDMFNQKYWRTQDYSVKWRPVFFDLDFAFKTIKRDMIGQYFNPNGVPSNDKSLTYFEIYIGLKKNAAWREYCVERYVEVVMTYFNSARATALLDEMAAAMRPEMARHIARWHKPSSVSEWEENIASLRSIVEQRPTYALENMARYFGVSDAKLKELIAKYS